MSFSTPEDVKAFFREFSNTSEAAIKDPKIQAWINIDEEYVMGKIYTLYARTITADANPLSVLVIADIVSMLVAARCDDVLNNYSEADKKPTWKRTAMDRLKEYVPDPDKNGKQLEPIIKLPDAIYVGTSTQTGRLKLSSTADSIFKKNADNW